MAPSAKKARAGDYELMERGEQAPAPDDAVEGTPELKEHLPPTSSAGPGYMASSLSIIPEKANRWIVRLNLTSVVCIVLLLLFFAAVSGPSGSRWVDGGVDGDGFVPFEPGDDPVEPGDDPRGDLDWGGSFHTPSEVRFADWTEGLWGHSAIDTDVCEECQLDPKLLRYGKTKFKFKALTHWTSKLYTCKATQYASFDTKGKLVIDCPKVATYMTDALCAERYPDKYEPSLQDDCGEFVKYTKAVAVPNAERVIAKCSNYRHAMYLARPVKQVERAKALAARQKEVYGSEKPLNVMVFMLDTVSRYGFLRTFRKLASTLEEDGRYGTGDHSVFQYFRYSTVGDGTLCNLPQLFAGCPPSVRLTGAKYDLAECKDKTSLDAYFADAGYMTTMFNSWDDFTYPDYWDQTGESLAANNVRLHEGHYLSLNRHFSARGARNGEGANGYNQMTNTDEGHCLSGVRSYALGLSYVDDVWAAYPDLPHFAFAHSMDGHNIKQLGRVGEEAVLAFYQKHKSDTVFVFMGDHGLIYGNYYLKYLSGRYEGLNPALFLSFPEGRLPEDVELNLLRNQQSLLSHFDLHRSLKELPALFASTEGAAKLSTPEFQESARSMLHDHVDPWRTCVDAGIDVVSCACIMYDTVTDQLTAAQKTSFIKTIVEAANMLSGDPQEEFCFKLEPKLFNIHLALAYRTGAGDYFKVTVVTKKKKTSSKVPRLGFVGVVSVDSAGTHELKRVNRVSEYAKEGCRAKLPATMDIEYCACKNSHDKW
jgi:hypothetical protein